MQVWPEKGLRRCEPCRALREGNPVPPKSLLPMQTSGSEPKPQSKRSVMLGGHTWGGQRVANIVHQCHLKAIFYGQDSVHCLRALGRVHMVSTLEPGFKGTFSLVLHLKPETASILQAVGAGAWEGGGELPLSKRPPPATLEAAPNPLWNEAGYESKSD